jgi:hypothetical protein
MCYYEDYYDDKHNKKSSVYSYPMEHTLPIHIRSNYKRCCVSHCYYHINDSLFLTREAWTTANRFATQENNYGRSFSSDVSSSFFLPMLLSILASSYYDNQTTDATTARSTGTNYFYTKTTTSTTAYYF